MRNRFMNGLAASILAITWSASAVDAAPVQLNQGESYTFFYDLSASPLTGPFTSFLYGFGFGEPDFFDNGEQATVELFDSSNTLLFSVVEDNTLGFTVGGVARNTNFTTSTSDKLGHATITATLGSFVLETFEIGYFDENGNLTEPTSFVDLTAIAVPEPSALLLFGMGLAGLARLRRRQAG